VQGVMHDVTERRLAAERLLESDSKYKAIIEKIPAITYLDPVNEESLSMYVSPQVQSILGCPPDIWLSDGAWWHNHVHPEDEPRVWATYVAHRESGEALSQEYRMVRDDGKVVWIREEATLLRDEDGKPWAIQGLMHDVTDTREMQQQVAFLGGHDSLTNLANRATFEQETTAAIDRARPRGHAVAVMVLNLDGFHQINQEFGHFVGDKLLKEVATRISRAVRDNDVVSRESGDEFLVLLADLEHDGASPEDSTGTGDGNDADRREPGRVDHGVTKLADRIETLMRSPAVIQGHTINPSVSLGISVFPEEGRDATTLIKNADAAMHRAKLIRREELAETSEA
jgi:PAS domain S-box-containing protein